MRFTGFEQYLRPGEAILWQGKDEIGDFPPVKKLLTAFACIAFAAFNIYLFKTTNKNFGMLIIAGIAVAITVAIVISLIMRYNFYRYYAVTGQRIFSFRTWGYGENAGLSVYDVTQVIVPVVSPIDDNGLYRVTFKGVSEMRIKRYTVRHRTYKETVAIPLEFVNIRDGKKVAELVNSILNEQHARPDWHEAYKEAYAPENSINNANDINAAYEAMFGGQANNPPKQIDIAKVETQNYRGGYVKEEKPTSIPTRSRSELPGDVQTYILDSFDERIYWYGDAKRKLGALEILLSVTGLVAISAVGIGMVIAKGFTPSTIATLFINVMTVIFFFVYIGYAYGRINCVVSNASVKTYLTGKKRKAQYVALRKATYAVPLGSDGVFIYFDEKGKGKREPNAFERGNLEMKRLAVALCGLSEYQQYEVIKAVEAAVEDI